MNWKPIIPEDAKGVRVPGTVDLVLETSECNTMVNIGFYFDEKDTLNEITISESRFTVIAKLDS